jgi:hypothetical protein
MVPASHVECSFFIPVRRDANLGDGDLQSTEAWRWLRRELYTLFAGQTLAPGLYAGVYKDPDSGQPVSDQSRRYIVAVPEERVDQLRELLRIACEHFVQKCIYLSVDGRVEFIGPEPDEP